MPASSRHCFENQITLLKFWAAEVPTPLTTRLPLAGQRKVREGTTLGAVRPQLLHDPTTQREFQRLKWLLSDCLIDMPSVPAQPLQDGPPFDLGSKR